MKKHGTIFAIAGAILLSLNIEISKYGYVLFLSSSVLWSIVSYKENENELFYMQMFFNIINTIGIIKWIVIPFYNP